MLHVLAAGMLHVYVLCCMSILYAIPACSCCMPVLLLMSLLHVHAAWHVHVNVFHWNGFVLASSSLEAKKCKWNRRSLMLNTVTDIIYGAFY
jgi:hypothetical protein